MCALPERHSHLIVHHLLLLFSASYEAPLLSVMTKSKIKTTFLKTVQGDFSLPVTRHGSASRATRALSRSRSPVQQAINSASPVSTPRKTPRKKAVLADFVTPLSGVRVSSKHRNKPMQRNSPSHSSTTPSACNEGSSGNLRSPIAPSACLAGSYPKCSYPGSGDPTRGPSSVSPS